MITPRRTRLLRCADLRAFRQSLVQAIATPSPLDARALVVLIPTAPAASQLRRTVEDAVAVHRGAVVLPDLLTREQFYDRLRARGAGAARRLSTFDREALLAASCRAAAASGMPPPFRLRPGLVVEILALYDGLRRQLRTVDDFERLLVDALEPQATFDRGAERMLRQTRFLVTAFREYEARLRESGAEDEHAIRARVIATGPGDPIRQVIVTGGDRQSDPDGLWLCDFDLLARLPGLERLDVVATERTLAAGFHQRVHDLLPGIEELRVDSRERPLPTLVAPDGDAAYFTTRDREEELMAVARRLKRQARADGAHALASEAVVFRRPLPYVYLARSVFDEAGLPFDCHDALPLAAEPYAAALDLVFAFVRSAASRTASVALLRSPHFRFEDAQGPITPSAVSALDRALSEAGYLGDPDQLVRLAHSWGTSGDPRRRRRGSRADAARSAAVAAAVAAELAPLRALAPATDLIDTLLAFLRGHERLPGPEDPLGSRHLRARAAIHGALTSFAAASARFDAAPIAIDDLAAAIRRWIEAQTFAPRAGRDGVRLLDAQAARFTEIDGLQIVGAVDGEWPDRPRRNIFYPPALLKQLGWPSDADRLAAQRAAFEDLLRSPARRVSVSTFALEDDAIVEPSPLLDRIDAAGLTLRRDAAGTPPRVFRQEALAQDPVVTSVLAPDASAWAGFRLRRAAAPECGVTAPHHQPVFTLTALERYLECPFRFFAADVLGLEEPPEDEPGLTPRARGRFIHEAFQVFFGRWQDLGFRTVTSERLDDARSLFREVIDPLLAQLPDADAALERTRLLGSAVAVGLADIVFTMEAEREREVVERLLEHPLEGEFALGDLSGRTVRLKGVADRIDLLEDGTLRVIDYKSGRAPEPKRALQVAIYSLCAEEQLAGRHGRTWRVGEAAYIAFTGKRSVLSIVKPGDDQASATLDGARTRLYAAVDAIGAGTFPPRPAEPSVCGYCAFALVCRKEYVDGG